MRTLLKAGEIVQEDEFGSKKPEQQVVRMADTPAVRLRPAGRRKLEEIPPSEVFLIAERKQLWDPLNDSFDEEPSFRKILEYFGYNQLTRTRKRHLQNLLTRFKQKKQDNQPDRDPSSGGRSLQRSLLTGNSLFD